ncbi:hypothetical protein FKP32DRAFT_1599234 [Trametes sanguinea]|nr:hypothetical protein FKP32DRAFT_1599234 [Trametes sanguinea]
MFASAAILLLAAASPALGNLFMTSPVASTTWAAGQQQTISWKDDGSAPSLSDLGPCKVSVYVGSQTQQTLVQSISDNVNVATTSSIVFTPDASSGENGNYYFIRVESLGFKDPNNSAYPAEAFSSKYTTSAQSTPAASPAANKVATTSSAAASGSASAKAAASTNGAASVSGSAIACVAGVAAIAYTMLF